MRNTLSRRQMLKATAGLGLAAGPWFPAWAASNPGTKMRLGLVTYLWGQDWDVPTLIANCEKTNFLGVELRTQHAHGVDPGLGTQQRREVRARFADSSVFLNSLYS